MAPRRRRNTASGDARDGVGLTLPGLRSPTCEAVEPVPPPESPTPPSVSDTRSEEKPVRHVSEVIELLESRGHRIYGGEPVSQLQHALQTAHQAERASAPDWMVVARLAP